MPIFNQKTLEYLGGLLGNMPITKALRGEDPMPSAQGFRAGLLSMPVFDSSPERMKEVEDLMLNFMSPMAALTFAGVGAKTANKGLLETAQKMDKAGADRAAIWNDTGWFKGPEGKWKFEIDDSGAIPGHKTYSWGEKADIDAGNSVTLKRQKALLHPHLSSNYPDTKGIGVIAYPNKSGGSYNSEFDNIAVGYQKNGAVDRSTMLHELQHAIQQREGFARGGNEKVGADAAYDIITKAEKRIRQLENSDEFYTSRKALDKAFNDAVDGKISTAEFKKIQAENPLVEEWSRLQNFRRNAPTDGYEAYRRLAGEAEARAVQARMNFDAAKRKAVPPWESYDIPWDQLIVR